MTTDNNTTSMWPVLIIVLFVGALLSAMFSNNSTPTTATFEPDPTSREYRYVKERVKLEGYSDREAAQAADAIMKFHNAQQNR